MWHALTTACCDPVVAPPLEIAPVTFAAPAPEREEFLAAAAAAAFFAAAACSAFS